MQRRRRTEMKKKKQNWQHQKLQITKWGIWGNQNNKQQM